MAPERFSCRLRPKWRVEPSLPQTILERRTANPRKYGQKQAQERDANSGIVNDLVTGCLSWKLIESCASHRSPNLEKSWNKCDRCCWPHKIRVNSTGLNWSGVRYGAVSRWRTPQMAVPGGATSGHIDDGAHSRIEAAWRRFCPPRALGKS